MALLLAFFVLLHAPSLFWGFFADDFTHRLVLEHPREHPTLRPWSLYDFGDSASAQAITFDDAVFPWWTGSDWKARFFRPLTSLSLWLDHEVWGRRAAGQHLTSLVLQGVFLTLVLWLYRCAGLAPGIALLAMALVALEDGSVFVVGWIANRNSLLEGIFTVAALGMALRARDSGRPGPMVLALTLAGLAALSKESGIAASAACALLWWRGPGPLLRTGSVAAALLALAYVVSLLFAGFGVTSLFYPTPWGEPSLWLEHLFVMLIAGPVSLLTPFPVDMLVAVPAAFWPGVILATLVLLVVAGPLARAAGAMAQGAFFAGFALLALLPEICAPPSDRLLFVPAIGLAPLTASWLAGALGSGVQRKKRAQRLAWLVALSALPLSGFCLFLRGVSFVRSSRLAREVVASAELDPRPTERRDVLVLQAPSGIALLGPLAAWRFDTGDRLTRFHALQLGQRAVRWTRVDPRTFELESLDEPFLSNLFERVFLTSSRPARAGERRRTSAFEVELRECEPGGVRRFRLRCDEPLEAERFVFLTWRDGRLRRIAPPASGQSVELGRCERLDPLLP